MIYDLTHSDDYLWYLISRGKKNTKIAEYEVPPDFQ